MSKLEVYELVIYFFTFLSVCLLGSLSFTKVKPEFANRAIFFKKIASVVFLITAIYWILTFPYVGSFYYISDKTEFPNKITAEKQVDYIVENRRRIESLEKELKETKDDLEAVRERIKMFLELFMFALIYFGVNWFFYANKNNVENGSNKLDL